MRRFSYGKVCILTAGAVLLSSVLTAGCANNGANSTQPGQNRTMSTQNSNGNIGGFGPGAMDRDDLMGRNQNPNLIVGHANTRNYQVDIDNMEMMAKSVPGVENCRITLNGGNAYVTLDLKHNITANEARNIERQVVAALQQKVPRYDFHVTSNDSYHR